MLTYRLYGTTEVIGVDHDEPHQCPPHTRTDNSGRPRAQSSPTTVRIEDGALLLTCGWQ